MTGAPMPAGADAVVMVERTRVDGDDASTSSQAATAGDHVRPAGGDLEVGQRVFDAGTLLTPAHLGVLASLDVAEVLCHPRPRVGVCSTGDELVASGPLAPGHDPRLEPPDAARRARGSGLRAGRLRHRPRRRGGARPRRSRARSTSATRCVTSGAVSMGDYDFVKVVLERLAGERPGEHVRVDADRDQAGEAARVRGDRRRAGVRPARQSGVVAGELRAARPARAAAARGPRRRAGRAGARGRARRRSGAGPTAGCTSTGWCVRYEDGGYVCERAGVQASNVLSGMAAATGLAILEDGDGVEAGDASPTCSCSDRSDCGASCSDGPAASASVSRPRAARGAETGARH